MKKREILLLGGDLRQYYMAESLVKRGFAISYYGILFPKELPQVHRCRNKEEVWKKVREEAAVLVLPRPMTSDGIYVKSNSLSDKKILVEEVPDYIKKGQYIFGGDFPSSFQEKIKAKEAQIVDFLKSDRVAIREAFFTVEGAIVEAKLLSDKAIFESKALVVGFGRIGKMLAEQLKAMGGAVVISGQEEARKLAKLSSFQVALFPLDKQGNDKWDFVFNTAEELLLDAKTLNLLGPEVVIIDMVSLTGSVDYDYARKHRIIAKHCLGLAGEYAAKSAGEMLAEELCRELAKQ